MQYCQPDSENDNCNCTKPRRDTRAQIFTRTRNAKPSTVSHTTAHNRKYNRAQKRKTINRNACKDTKQIELCARTRQGHKTANIIADAKPSTEMRVRTQNTQQNRTKAQNRKYDRIQPSAEMRTRTHKPATNHAHGRKNVNRNARKDTTQIIEACTRAQNRKKNRPQPICIQTRQIARKNAKPFAKYKATKRYRIKTKQ